MLTEEGPGFPFFLPGGMTLKNTLIDYWREVHKKYGYVEVSTPVILSRKLWERSGHWEHYKNNMYTTVIDDEDFAIKPMNCPGGMLVYKSQPHSYRELPLRVGELGPVSYTHLDVYKRQPCVLFIAMPAFSSDTAVRRPVRPDKARQRRAIGPMRRSLPRKLPAG